MLGCKAVENLVRSQKLEESDESVPVDKGRYQQLVGWLIYLSHIRLDIAYTVNTVSLLPISVPVDNTESVIQLQNPSVS